MIAREEHERRMRIYLQGHREGLSISAMSRMAGISPQGYVYWMRKHKLEPCTPPRQSKTVDRDWIARQPKGKRLRLKQFFRDINRHASLAVKPPDHEAIGYYLAEWKRQHTSNLMRG